MKKLLGLLVVAGLMFVVTPSQQANAMSLAAPGTAAAADHATVGTTTEVHWRRHWHPHRRHWHRGHRWEHRRWGFPVSINEQALHGACFRFGVIEIGAGATT